MKFEPSIPSKTTMAQEGHSPVLVFDSLVMVLHSLVMVLHSLVLVFTQSSFNFYTVQFYFFTQSSFIFTESSLNLMIREEVKRIRCSWIITKFVFITNSGPFVDDLSKTKTQDPGGGGVLPYKGLMGTCGQPGYVFRDFCLKQGIDFIIFCLKQSIFSWTINSLRVCCTNVLNRVGKSAIFVLNRVRV